MCESLDHNEEDRIPSTSEIFNKQKADLAAKDEKLASLEKELTHSHFRLSETTRQIENLSQRVNLLTSEIQTRDQEIETLQRESHHFHSSQSADLSEENRQLRLRVQHLEENVAQLHQNAEYYQAFMPELEQLRGLVSQQQQQISSYYAYFEGLKESGDTSAALVMENAELSSRIGTLDSLLFSWQTEATRVKEELEEKTAEFVNKQDAVEQLASELRKVFRFDFRFYRFLHPLID